VGSKELFQLVDAATGPAQAVEPPANMIELHGVSKWFGNKSDRLTVIDNIDLAVPNKPEGEFVALLGPSGSGKSTILTMLAGLVQPDAGEVVTNGRLVTGPNPDTVTVQQNYTCFPWLTVLGNVEFGLSIAGVPSDKRLKIAMHYLEKVELADRAKAFPKELSGGMQQRVAIARALALSPEIVLMDEPFGALDAQTRSDMQQMLLKVWAEETNCVFFITHDITEALLLADRVIVLSPRPAKIVQDLTVPFPRPRLANIVYEEQFIQLSQALLQMLKKSPGSGQVRVSI
jgi:NitT/TauT family transport system ATP-binding protein